ncbi:helix-turn-helix domain-containing protein [Congregibacter sp.]|uniref:helix-turn-helix domain-containing protein n=1 Tax=Congregibacter sp. TaxID=2744308 RepID=UPI003F6B7E83
MPVERCLSKANLPHSELIKNEGLLSLVSCYRFLELVSKSEDVSELGEKVAERTSVLDLGGYGSLLGRSATVGDYIDRGIRFMADHSNHGCTMWLSCEEDSVRIHQRMALGDGIGPAIVDAYTLVMTINTLRQWLGPQWIPNDLALRSGTAELLGSWLSEASPGNLRTQQPHTSFTVPRRALGLPVSQWTHDAVTQAFGSSVPAMPEGFLAAVEYLVESLDCDGKVSIDMLAESMGTSTRHLQRRLAMEGCSYTEIVARTRLCRAQQWLRDSPMSVAEIAAELGYTDASNFARAFRRASGASPAEYRKWHAF